MFKILFIKEIKELIQSNRFTISFIVCTILVLMSFYMGGRNYQTARAQYEAAKTENLNQLAANTDWQGIQHTIILPPEPLMALVTGISNDIGRTIDMRTRGELRAENSRYNDEPLFAIFTFMDLEFIFGILLSLFAILLAFDAINGEKQSGTLKLCFSNPVPRSTFILAKFAGIYVGILVALMIPLLIGSLLFPLLGIQFSSDEWFRLILILLAGLLYLGVFLGIAITVSTFTKSPSNSFLAGLIIWILVVLVLPKSSVLMAGRMVEVPNIDELNAEKSRYRSQLFMEDRNKMNDFRSDAKDPEEFMKDFNAFMSQLTDARQEKIDLFEERLNEEYRNRVDYRQSIALKIARSSPYAIFNMVITNLSATSLNLKNTFIDQAESYQNRFADFINEKTGSRGSGFRIILSSRSDVAEQKEEPIDPGELPVFEMHQHAAGTLIAESVPDLLLLSILNLVIFGTGFVRFRNYDLR